MKIIAKTKEGCLIQATDKEVMAILTAVASAPKRLEIGQKIPAIDYAATITKVKALKDSFLFRELELKIKRFSEEFGELANTIKQADELEI